MFPILTECGKVFHFEEIHKIKASISLSTMEEKMGMPWYRGAKSKCPTASIIGTRERITMS